MLIPSHFTLTQLGGDFGPVLLQKFHVVTKWKPWTLKKMNPKPFTHIMKHWLFIEKQIWMFLSTGQQDLMLWGRFPHKVGSPEGGLHESGSLRVFPTDGEHTSMGTSTYLKQNNLIFFFPPFFPSCFFLNFPDLYLSSLYFWNFLIRPIKKSFHGNMGM